MLRHSRYMLPRRGFSLAAVVPPPPPPPSGVLDALAHATPGTSTFSKPLFEVGSDTPYPIWFLDPHGLPYRSVLSFAQRSGDVLTGIHEATSLPWWATVVGVGVCIRVALLPFTLYSMRNASRAGDAALDIVALRRGYARARAALDSAAPAPPAPASLLGPRLSLAATLARGVRAALHKVHCYPARSLAMPLLQIPPVLAGVMGARHVVLLGDTSFETGGILWFKDLTLPDPTFALPAIALSLAYVSLEVMFARPTPPPPATATATAAAIQPIPTPTPTSTSTSTSTPALLLGAGGIAGLVKEGLQLSIILTLPFTIELPAGLYLLMAANSMWTIGFLSMVRTPAVYHAITGRYPGGRVTPELAAAAAKDGGGGSGSGGGGGGGGVRLPSSSPYAVFTPAPAAFAASLATAAGVGGGQASALADIGGASSLPFPSFPPLPPPSSNSSELLMLYSSTPDVPTTTTTSTSTSTPTTLASSLAANLQQTPRMLYYDEESLDRSEEMQSMVTIQQCMNTGLPVVGGANPLVLRFAGAAASNTAPWVHLEAMPSLEEEEGGGEGGGGGVGHHQDPKLNALPTLTAEDLIGEVGDESGIQQQQQHSTHHPSNHSIDGKVVQQQQQQQQQQQLYGEGERVLAAFRDLWPSAMLHPGYAVSSGGTGGVLNGPFPSALLPPSFMGASAALALPPSQVWWEHHHPQQQQQLQQQQQQQQQQQLQGGGMIVTVAGGGPTTLHARWLEVHRREQQQQQQEQQGKGGGYAMFSSEVSFLGGLSSKQQQQQQEQQQQQQQQQQLPVVSVSGGERKKKPTPTSTTKLSLPFFSLARQQGGSSTTTSGGSAGGMGVGSNQRKRKLGASAASAAAAATAAAAAAAAADAESASALAEMQQRQLDFDITKELVSILQPLTPPPSTSTASSKALLLPPLPVRVSEGIGREHTFLVGLGGGGVGTTSGGGGGGGGGRGGGAGNPPGPPSRRPSQSSNSGGGGGGGKQIDASFERSKNSGQRGQAVFLPSFLLRQEIHELGFTERSPSGGDGEGEKGEGGGEEGEGGEERGGGGRKKKGGGKRGWKRE